LRDVDLGAGAVARVDAAVPDLPVAGQLSGGEQFAVVHAAQREVPFAHALAAQADVDQQQRAYETGIAQRALALLPSHALAMVAMANVCAVRRRFAEATTWLEQALLVDPLDAGLHMNFGDHMILQHDFDAAASALRKTLEIAPGHRPSQLRLCWALALASNDPVIWLAEAAGGAARAAAAARKMR